MSKSVIYQFRFDFVKPKHGENADSFIADVKTEDTYKDNAEDVETRFDT